jgi:hypothetical protein
VLPVLGCTDLVLHILHKHTERNEIAAALLEVSRRYSTNETFVMQVLSRFEITLEAMISDGWVRASYEPSVPMTPLPNNRTVLEWLASYQLELPET